MYEWKQVIIFPQTDLSKHTIVLDIFSLSNEEILIKTSDVFKQVLNDTKDLNRFNPRHNVFINASKINSKLRYYFVYFIGKIDHEI